MLECVAAQVEAQFKLAKRELKWPETLLFALDQNTPIMRLASSTNRADAISHEQRILSLGLNLSLELEREIKKEKENSRDKFAATCWINFERPFSFRSVFYRFGLFVFNSNLNETFEDKNFLPFSLQTSFSTFWQYIISSFQTASAKLNSHDTIFSQFKFATCQTMQRDRPIFVYINAFLHKVNHFPFHFIQIFSPSFPDYVICTISKRRRRNTNVSAWATCWPASFVTESFMKNNFNKPIVSSLDNLHPLSSSLKVCSNATLINRHLPNSTTLQRIARIDGELNNFGVQVWTEKR